MSEFEQEIQEKGLVASRVTPDMVQEAIAGEDYHIFPGTTLTVCCLKLQNGFTVTGESACASPENFDEELGRKIARKDAENKIWMLEGYLLREQLSARWRRNLLSSNHGNNAITKGRAI